jgi:hypothetical protein
LKRAALPAVPPRELLLWGAKFCLSAQAWSTPKFSPQNDAKCSLPTSQMCRRGSITNKKNHNARQTYYAKHDPNLVQNLAHGS